LHANASHCLIVLNRKLVLRIGIELIRVAFSVRSFLDHAFENEYLVSFLLILNQVLASDDRNVPFIRTDGHGNDFVPLPFLGGHEFDLHQVLINLAVVYCVESLNVIYIRHQKHIVRWDKKRAGTFIIRVVRRQLEIVPVLSSVDVEVFLVLFESHALQHLASEHHLSALHKVVHCVLQSRYVSLRVHKVKVDFVICAHLDALVAFYEVNKCSLVNRMVEFPFDFASHLVLSHFKEQNFAGASHN